MNEQPDDDDDADGKSDRKKKKIEQRVQEHIERRKDAYVKMGTVDSEPDAQD